MNTFAATIKQVDKRGGFTAVASTDSVDRDGEILAAKCFQPLASSVPILMFHNFSDPVGRATPYYVGNELRVDAVFGSTQRAQEARQMVLDGSVGHVSVGFMAAQRQKDSTGQVRVTSAELLEVSLVSVPSNRDARVLVAKDARSAVSRLPISKEMVLIRGLLALAEVDLLDLEMQERRTRPAATKLRDLLKDL